MGNTRAWMSKEYSGGMINILNRRLITPNTLSTTFRALACCKLNNSSGVAGLQNLGN